MSDFSFIVRARIGYPLCEAGYPLCEPRSSTGGPLLLAIVKEVSRVSLAPMQGARVLRFAARHVIGLVNATVCGPWDRTAQRNAWEATCDDLLRRGGMV
jgi:hypothetical protein